MKTNGTLHSSGKMLMWNAVKTWLKSYATRESYLLVVLVAISAAGWLFLEIQDEVSEGELLAFDERILLAFRVEGVPQTLRGPE